MKTPSTETLQSVQRPLAAHYQPHLDFWQQAQPRLSDVAVVLPDQCIDELDTLINTIGELDHQILPNLPGLEHCKSFANKIDLQLSRGTGVAVIDGFPVERYSDAQNQQLCGVFASLLGPLMAQDIHGTRLYSVKDARVDTPNAVRKSKTNQAQPLHTDGGWFAPPAHYVGLFCVRSADNGGGSRVTSLMRAYDTLQNQPDTLSALCNALPWDKQGEHLAADPATAMNPVFELSDEKFVARFYESYVRNGYEKKGESIAPEVDAALTTLNNTMEDQPMLEFGLQTGQLMYLNNHTTVHARAAFNENKPESGGRFLVRVWNQ